MSYSSRVSRYPRWGYLDKFEVSPYLMRSVLTTSCVHVAALAAFVVWQHLGPRASIPNVSERPHRVPIMPLPLTIEPTATTRARPGPPVVVPAREFTMPIPVPDERAAPESIAPAVTGTGDGTPTPAPGTWESICCAERAVLPDPGVFIAVEVEPELVTMEAPVYPDLAREAGVSGDVLVRVLVGTDGRIMQAFVLVSVPMLDDAALAAARTAMFKPALQSGRPVAVWVNVPISFRLHD